MKLFKLPVYIARTLHGNLFSSDGSVGGLLSLDDGFICLDSIVVQFGGSSSLSIFEVQVCRKNHSKTSDSLEEILNLTSFKCYVPHVGNRYYTSNWDEVFGD